MSESADFIVIIPARLGSSRLPNKPLADIGGRPMVVRVAERAQLSGAARVIVACDDLSVQRACEQHGIDSVMTRSDHLSGTDRLAEVAAALQLADSRIVVNLQGDEPLIDPTLIAQVAATLAADSDAAMATAAQPIDAAAAFFDPNVVKVVCNAQGHAQYFSRAPIPYARDAFALASDHLPSALPALWHVGIYAYRAAFLRRYSALAPAPSEQWEALEQLRALHHGFKIAVHLWRGEVARGVDTAEDLERVRALFG